MEMVLFWAWLAPHGLAPLLAPDFYSILICPICSSHLVTEPTGGLIHLHTGNWLPPSRTPHPQERWAGIASPSWATACSCLLPLQMPGTRRYVVVGDGGA